MSTVKYTPRLAEKYKKEVVPALMKKFGYSTVMQAPKLEKICINRGVNGAVTDKKLVEVAVDELSQITGQKAVTTQSKKDISNFKLRKNMPIGARVTLRGEKMFEFLDRLVSTAYHACGISRGSMRNHSMAGVIIRWGSRNRSFSPRSTLTR